MNPELITKLVEAIVTVVVVLISAYVIPWLKGKIGEDKYNQIKYYIEYAVRCAEQIYKEDQSKEKKEYVMSYITHKLNDIGITMTEEDISVLIESTVNYIKYGMEYNR